MKLEKYLQEHTPVITLITRSEIDTECSDLRSMKVSIAHFLTDTNGRDLLFDVCNDDGDSIEVKLEGMGNKDAQLRFNGEFMGNVSNVEETIQLLEESIDPFFENYL